MINSVRVILHRQSGVPAFAEETCEGSYCPVSKLHCAPPPAFCMISFGSIVHRNLEMLSMLEPAAPSEECRRLPSLRRLRWRRAR